MICRKHDIGLYAAFVDLTKAFDTVSRDGLWKILERLGYAPKFLTTLRQLSEGQQGQVKHNGHRRATSPTSTASSRGTSWPRYCSPSSSASCFVRQKTACLTAFASVSEQTAVSSTFSVCLHARKPSRNSSLSYCLLTTASFSSTRRNPTSYRRPLLRCSQELRPHHQPEDD